MAWKVNLCVFVMLNLHMLKLPNFVFCGTNAIPKAGIIDNTFPVLAMTAFGMIVINLIISLN